MFVAVIATYSFDLAARIYSCTERIEVSRVVQHHFGEVDTVGKQFMEFVRIDVHCSKGLACYRWIVNDICLTFEHATLPSSNGC